MSLPAKKIDVSEIKCPLIPRYDRVILSPLKHGEKVSNGVIIPEIASERESLQFGYVIKAGPGKPGEPIELLPGELAAYMNGAGTPIEYEKEKYLIIRDVDVIAKADFDE
jgi:co-chaperonin GroES (HSP10)